MNKENNITGYELKEQLKHFLQYVGGTKELQNDLENCVIINKNRLAELGVITIKDEFDRTTITFKSNLNIRKRKNKLQNAEEQYIGFTKDEIVNAIIDELVIKFNGLHMVNPDTLE